MYKLKKPDIHASEISGLINQELIGDDILINTPSTYEKCIENSFICVLNEDQFDLTKICSDSKILIITNRDLEHDNLNISYIKSPNPRLDFIRAVNEYFIDWDEIRIASSAKIHSKAILARNVSIGENVVIGPDVKIDENTKILNNVVITNQVEIGSNCIIKHNSTIGSEGFDFEIDKLGVPIHYPHMGKIVIGNNVWIGANTSIESGKIDNTIINNDVKVDDLVQIGYNCVIGERTMVTAGVIIERDVKIGNDVLLAPNSTIRNNIEIADNTIIGDGAVVVKNAESNSVYVGNPAKFLKSKTD